MSSKKWLAAFFILIAICLMIVGTIVLVIDPYFHYHAPLSFLEYRLSDERYINNGIVRHFDYDALITGTSHAGNFKASEFNDLFDCDAIKVSLYGAELKELAEQTTAAIKSNPRLKQILFSLTYEDILRDKDAVMYDDCPTYLYDNNIFNDYKYLFSGNILKRCYDTIRYTLDGFKTTNFDDYTNWSWEFSYSREDVMAAYKRSDTKKVARPLSEEEKQNVTENINQNILDIIRLNDDITFYICFTPHSIVWWDRVSQSGEIVKYLEAEEILVNALLECDNVKLYSFFNNYDFICDLDHYKDETHYPEEINSQILQWIKNDEYLLTKENVDEYLSQEKQFYLNYPYDELFVN